MRIYIATRFTNLEEYRQAKDALESLGHVISHDWSGEKVGDRQGTELEEFLNGCAVKDMYGVVTADALLVINHADARGTLVEMGMAIAKEIPVFVAFPERVSNIFTHLMGVESCADIDSAVEAVDNYSQLVGF
jgi:nucleoside 2-deoxyribosyltransferase